MTDIFPFRLHALAYDHVAPYMHDPSSNLATNIYVNGLPSQ